MLENLIVSHNRFFCFSQRVAEIDRAIFQFHGGDVTMILGRTEHISSTSPRSSQESGSQFDNTVHRGPALCDFVTSTANSQTILCSEHSERALKGLGHDKLKKVSKQENDSASQLSNFCKTTESLSCDGVFL